MKPQNNLYVDAAKASFILPTHVTFEASSSLQERSLQERLEVNWSLTM